jgi:hypothetical protein
MKLYLTLDLRWRAMVFNATLNNISVVSWLLICWLEELRVIRVIDKVNCRIDRLKIVIYMTITTTTVNIKNVSKINK